MTQPLTEAELAELEDALADIRDNVRGSIWTDENQARYRRREQAFARYGRQLFEEVKRHRAPPSVGAAEPKRDPVRCRRCGRTGPSVTEFYTPTDLCPLCAAGNTLEPSGLGARPETALPDPRVIPALQKLRLEIIKEGYHTWGGWIVGVLRMLGDVETPQTGGEDAPCLMQAFTDPPIPCIFKRGHPGDCSFLLGRSK